MTETSPAVLLLRKALAKKYPCSGSVGRPLPNTLAKVVPIDNPRAAPLGPNEKGEILVKGTQVMKGYLNRPEETKDAFADGWFRTGDVGYYNEDRLFYITDRAKELIKVKGFQVPPAELEGIIRSFPDVSDAAVIGIPHELYGEVPRAYVVSQSGKTIDTNKLDEFVASKVAQYKQLKGGIAVVSEIPKNASGKILRNHLKQQYLGKKQ